MNLDDLDKACDRVMKGDEFTMITNVLSAKKLGVNPSLLNEYEDDDMITIVTQAGKTKSVKLFDYDRDA